MQGIERRLRQALLPDQALEGPVAAAAGRDLELAGLGALGVEDRPDVEALQEPAPGDVLGQVLDRDAGLQAPDVRLAEHQLVEGDVARGAEDDLLNGLCHVGILRDGRPGDSLSTSKSVTETGAALSLSIVGKSENGSCASPISSLREGPSAFAPDRRLRRASALVYRRRSQPPPSPAKAVIVVPR